MAEKKKRGFLSKLGFKSKEEKLALAAAEKAAAQKLVDEQMAERMAAINAAALKSAREQDEQAAGASEAELAEIEAEEKRLADIQAAKDVARAKQLAEEKKRKEEAAREAAKKAAEDKAAAEADAARKEKEAAEAKAKAEAEAQKAKAEAEAARKAEDARIKAEQDAALAKAKSEADAAALKAKQEEDAAALAKAREEADAKAAAEKLAEQQRLEAERIAAEKAEAERVEAEKLAAEKAEAQRLRDEAIEAERRAKIAEEQAAREIAEQQAAQKAAEDKAAQPAPDTPEAAPKPETDTLAKGNFLSRITAGLRKSTTRMTDQVSAVFTKRKLDDAAIEELEDILIGADLGIGPASKVTALLAKDKFDKQVTDMEVKIALADVISDILTPLEKPIVLGAAKPQIFLFVGVNGSGKTTTLGKIAKRYTDQGKKVLIAAGDTFRAAAVEQLTIWGERSGAPVMSASTGADAAGLVFDAITRAREENYDILMIDTAGRLQNRTELMDELSKIIRVIQKQDPSAPHHSILVLDATVGQNALIQTEAFRDTAGVTGLIMTKLDGTAKGGVLVALSDKYALPIHHIGIGERIEDLENFSAPVFAAALSGVSDAMM